MGQPLWFMHDNAFDQGTLSLGSWGGTLPNLQDPRPSKQAVSTDTNPANTKFLLTLPYSRAFRGALIVNTNLNQSGRVKVTGYSNAALSSVAGTTDWITVGAARSFALNWGDPYYWTGRTPRVDPDRRGLDIPVVFASTITAKYWLFEFENPSNAAGIIRVGRPFMGPVFQPTINFAPGAELRWLTSTVVKESVSRTPYFRRRKRYPELRVSFPWMSRAEILGEWHRFIEICGLTKQVAVFIDPDATALADRQAFLGRLPDLPAEQFENIDLAPTSLAITGYV